MRVGLGQLDMIWEDKDASILKATDMIKTASMAACDIIIFPEMSFTGFSLNLDLIGENISDSYTMQRIRVLAKEYHIAIGYGWAALPEQSEKKGTNRFTIIDSNGTILSDYAKIHPFTYGGESDIFKGGNSLSVVSFKGRKIATFICYDLRFPEIFQIAAKEADIMFVIANWPSVRIDQWKALLKARAIETQSYFVGVNCFGSHGDIDYDGSSMAVDAIGNVIGYSANQENLTICDLDDRAGNLRNKFSTAKDRREELYKQYM